MKNIVQKQVKPLKTIKETGHGKYKSVDVALNAKHKKANDFIKKVKLTF